MPRVLLYYALTVLAGAAMVAGMLNVQFIILHGGTSDTVPSAAVGAWRSDRPWELLVIAWGALIYSLSCLLLSWLSDRFGRLVCIAATTALMATVNAVFGWPFLLGEPRLFLFFAYWFVVNFCFAVFFTSVEGLLSDYQDHRVPLARRLGAYCLSWCGGHAVAAFLVGTVNQTFGAESVFQTLAVLWGLGCAATLVDWRFHGAGRLGAHSIGVADIRPEAPFHARLGRLGIFFGCLAYTAMASGFPRYGGEFHGLPKSVVGISISAILFSAVVAFWVLARWPAWHYRRGWQWGLQAPMAVGVTVVILAPAGALWTLFPGFILFGLGWGAAYFFSIYYSLTVPQDHAKSGGLHEAVLGFGNLMGPLTASGLLWLSLRGEWMARERVGVVAFAVAMAGVLLSLVLQAIWMRRRRVETRK